MQLDPESIAENVIKNNMGVGGITLQVRGTVKDTTVVLAETAQTFPITKAPAVSTKPWLVFQVEGFGEGEMLSLAWLMERDAPSAEPTADPAH